MAYLRVIPRDLFNEANLLKCLGTLWIKLEAIPNHAAFLDDGGSLWSFEIEQDTGSGAIFAGNLPFTIGGKPYLLTRPLNSRRSWPLYATGPEDGVTEVFTDEGELTEEFLDLIAATGIEGRT